MALFDGSKLIEGSRSNTHLVKSGHMSPAEDWLLDPNLTGNDMSSVFDKGVLFKYQYGGAGNEDVVIPKGRVVGVSGQVKDFVSKQYKTTLSLPGMTIGNNTIGMAPYNFTKNYFQNDRFGGNQLSVITLDYVTLPWIPEVTPSVDYSKTGVLSEEKDLTVNMKMPWGAVIGDAQPGDYVKATPSGRLCKWKKGTDDFSEVVGQILAGDFNSEPWGWMKWMLWEEQYRQEDDEFINRSGASNLPSDSGYPFDPIYRDGNTIYQQYQSNMVTNPTGIPGLHDGSGNYVGFGKGDYEYKEIELGTLPSSVIDGTYMALQAKNYKGLELKNLKEVTSVKVGERALEPTDYTVDYVKGIITVQLKTGDADKKIKANYKANQYGIPSYVDFKGVQGSLFVLLKK